MRTAFLALALSLLPVTGFAQGNSPPTPPAQNGADGILLIFPPPPDGTTQANFPTGWTAQIDPTAFRTYVNPEVLGKSFRDFIQKVGSALRVDQISVGTYEVEEIQLNLTLTGEGSVGFIVGGSAGASGGITVVLRRSPAATPRRP